MCFDESLLFLRPKICELSSFLQRIEGISRCRSVGALGARLKDHVYTVNISANRATALLFDAFKPQLITTDGQGCVKVWDYTQSYLLNQFPVISGASALLSSCPSIREFT